jgi:hypothetical protein
VIALCKLTYYFAHHTSVLSEVSALMRTSFRDLLHICFLVYSVLTYAALDRWYEARCGVLSTCYAGSISVIPDEHSSAT